MAGTIGSVAVAVVPSAQGFNDALREEILPGADELGQEIGERIRAGIEDGLQDITFTVHAESGQADAAMADLQAQRDDLAVGETDIDFATNAAETGAEIADLAGDLAGAGAQAADTAGSVGELDAAQAGLDGSAAAAAVSLQAEADALGRIRDQGAGAAGAVAGTAAADGDAAAGAAAATAGLEAEAEALGRVRDNAGQTAGALGGLGGAQRSVASGGGDSGGGGIGFLGALLGVAIALGPALITAGAAEAVFAGAAIPDILEIVHNSSELGSRLTDVKTEYQALADSVKPEVIGDFDIALDQAKAVIPEFTGAAQAGGRALGQFEAQFGHFLQSSDTKGFLAFISDEVSGDLHSFGNLMQGAATAGAGFAESLNGVSRDAINAAGGLLSFTGEALTTVPLLGPLALGAVAVAIGFAKIPPMLDAISGSNLAQWLSGSEQGLSAFGEAFRTAASAGQAEMAAIGEEAAGLEAQIDALTARASVLDAELSGMDASMGGFTAEAAAMDAELAAAEAEMAGLEAELVGLDAAMAAAAAEGGVLDGVMAVLGAVNPFVWAAVAAAGLAILTDKMVTGASIAQTYYTALQQQYGATGNNVQAAQNFASAMQDGGSAADALTRQLQQQTSASARFGVATQVSAQQTAQLSAAQKEAAAHVLEAEAAQGRLTSADLQADQATAVYGTHLQQLQQKYNLSTQGAIQLANGAKVSTQALTLSGAAGAAAMSKVEAYANAGAKASSQTVQFAVDMSIAASNAFSLQTRVAALSTALNSESSGTDSAIGAAVSFQQSLVTLQQDMQASGNKAGYLTTAQQATANALAQADTAARGASAGILQTGGSAAAAAAPLEALRGQVAKLQDPTAAEKQLLSDLNAEIDALHDKTITITVREVGSATDGGSQFSGASNTGVKAAASGLYVDQGRPGVDDQLILAQRGELVVPVPMVSAGEVDHLRGRIPGFATGGVVGATGSGDALNFEIVMNILDGSSGGYSTTSRGVSAADTLAKEFSDGALKTVTQIRDAGNQAIKELKEYYTGPHQAELISAMNKQVTALDALAQKSSTIATEIANMKTYAAQETSSLSGFADLSTVQGQTAADGSTLPVTGSDISGALAQDLATLKQFIAVIKQLQAAKVSKVLINQVIALGPTQGVVYGQAILAGGATLIKELNTDESQIASAETTVGQEAADIQYGQNIGTGIGKGFTASLKTQAAAINKEMASYGDAIAEELLKALHGNVKLPGVSTAAVKAATTLSSSSAAVGGTVGAAAASGSGPSAAQMAKLIAAVDTTDDNIKALLSATRSQTTQILAQLRALPKSEAAAIGPAVAGALNGVAQKAAQAARTSTR